jgi:hypothetical protein
MAGAKTLCTPARIDARQEYWEARCQHPRAIPQQSISTISNVDDIESHIQTVEAYQGKTYLEVFELPASERRHVMQELALMGITAGSLFPGLEGACESLRERNF